MAFFWQLSGPDSHFIRDWRVTPDKDVGIGNAKIASQVFHSMSHKVEDEDEAIDLVLGIEATGASHILVPEGVGRLLRGLSWKHRDPYPATKFASLSPIRAGRKKLQNLLDDRQVVSKSTAASKNKGDNSKANQVFWDGPPRPARAAFEHGRCFWRILHKKLHPQLYGLPDALWSSGLDIISLAMNFWTADGTTLLDAGMTCIHLPSGSSPSQDEEQTWYFKSKDCEVLRNFNTTGVDVPLTWKIIDVDNDDKASIGAKIQHILEAHSRVNGSMSAPLILLVHDYVSVKDSLVSLGVQTSTWNHELKDLLGYCGLDRAQYRGMKNDPRLRRTRSRSTPRTGSSTGLFSRETRSPVPMQPYAPVYVVDTMTMFKTVTGSGNHASTIRPVDIFNKITCNNEDDSSCGGSDSKYIMQSWKKMVSGASVDEQKAFYMNSLVAVPVQPSSGPGDSSEAAGHGGLYQREESYDLFNDGSDSEDDY